jgi:hypothetical protein
MIRPSSPLTMLLLRHTRRREFITFLGGAAATWAQVARARQPGRLPIVGILGLGSGACSKLVAPLMQRLHLKRRNPEILRKIESNKARAA